MLVGASSPPRSAPRPGPLLVTKKVIGVEEVIGVAHPLRTSTAAAKVVSRIAILLFVESSSVR